MIIFPLYYNSFEFLLVILIKGPYLYPFDINGDKTGRANLNYFSGKLTTIRRRKSISILSFNSFLLFAYENK